MINKPKQATTNFEPIFSGDGVELKNITNFPFSNPLGIQLPTQDGGGLPSVPGICVVYYKYGLGTSLSMNSGANKAARAYYNYVTQGFTSTNSSFEASDLVVEELCVTDLALRLLEAKRVYGLMTSYSPYNRYLAKQLVEALGWDYQNLSENLANFRAAYNIRVDHVNKALPIPPGFKYMLQMANYVSRIFCDNVVEKFQIYAFRPSSYLLWSPATSEQGSAITEVENAYEVVAPAQKVVPSKWTYQSFFLNFDNALEALLNDTDVNNMSGAIQRVYGTENMQLLTPLEEGYVTYIQYDPDMLKQIQNMNLVGRVGYTTDNTTSSNLVVYQENNVIYSNPCLKPLVSVAPPVTAYLADKARYLSNDLILTLPYENPSHVEVADALALKPVVEYPTPTGAYSTINHLGIIPEFMCLYYVNTEGQLDYVVAQSSILYNADSSFQKSLEGTGLQELFNIFEALAAFDWHPNVVVYGYAVEKFQTRLFYDLCNYTVIGVHSTVAAQQQINYARVMNTINTRDVTKK